MASKAFRERAYGSYASTHQTYRKHAADASPKALPHLFAFVRRHFPADRNARILDVGCGGGDLLLTAFQLGYRNLVGVDLSAEQVELAHARGLDQVKLADAFQFLQGAPDQSLDCIVSYDVIEHFDRDELVAFCDLVHRKLCLGGAWIIHVPNAEGIFGSRIRYGDITHELAFTQNSLEQILRMTGFSEFEFFPDRPVAHGLTSAVRWVIWHLVEIVARIALAAETGQFRSHILTQNLIAKAYKRSAGAGHAK